MIAACQLAAVLAGCAMCHWNARGFKMTALTASIINWPSSVHTPCQHHSVADRDPSSLQATDNDDFEDMLEVNRRCAVLESLGRTQREGLYDGIKVLSVLSLLRRACHLLHKRKTQALLLWGCAISLPQQASEQTTSPCMPFRTNLHLHALPGISTLPFWHVSIYPSARTAAVFKMDRTWCEVQNGL